MHFVLRSALALALLVASAAYAPTPIIKHTRSVAKPARGNLRKALLKNKTTTSVPPALDRIAIGNIVVPVCVREREIDKEFQHPQYTRANHTLVRKEHRQSGCSGNYPLSLSLSLSVYITALGHRHDRMDRRR